MKSNVKNMLRLLSGLMMVLVMATGVAIAQQPTPTPKKADAKKSEPKAETTSAQTGQDSGNYTITSSIEFGYRGIRVDGDVNKYKSDLNYKAGPRIFDSSFLMQAKDGKLYGTTFGGGINQHGVLFSYDPASAFFFKIKDFDSIVARSNADNFKLSNLETTLDSLSRVSVGCSCSKIPSVVLMRTE